MKLLIFLAYLSVCYGSINIKSKRGVFGEGLFLGGIHDLGTAVDLNHASYSNNYETSKYAYGIPSSTIDLGSTIHKHITVTNNIGIPVFQPYVVPIEKKIAVPVPHPVAVPIDKPYQVQIAKPFAVPIDKPYPVRVEKITPYSVNVPVRVPVSVPIAVPVPKPVAVPIHKVVPFVVPQPVNVFKAVAVVKSPIVSLGSGSLGYTHLGNGAYALGSGSLGITGLTISGVSKSW